MADWHWEPVTDDLLDGLPPAALAVLRQVAEELTVRESMIFLDGREFAGSNSRPADYEKPGPALRTRCPHGYHGYHGAGPLTALIALFAPVARPTPSAWTAAYRRRAHRDAIYRSQNRGTRS